MFYKENTLKYTNEELELLDAIEDKNEPKISGSHTRVLFSHWYITTVLINWN